jgi:hypothetical protein
MFDSTLRRLAMRMLLLLFGVWLSVGNGAAQESRPPDKSRIRQLIAQLGAKSFNVREAAHRELTLFVEYAATELGEATESADLERARRAKQILGWVGANPTHRIVDAQDRPIKMARVVLKQGGATQVGFTDRLGRFAVPDPDKRAATDLSVEVRHPEYGIARWYSGTRSPSANAELIDCKMPIVAQDSAARKRSVQGQVVDGLGKPVAGAVLRCSHVRTQGDGLMTADAQAGEAITDGQGQFTLYLVANKPNRGSQLHGELVPPGSRYSLSVTAPERDDCFPVDDLFSNDTPLTIRMPRATRLHRFQFAQPGGGVLTDAAQLKNLAVDFYPIDGDPRRVRLATDEVLKGRKLIPGKYVATHYQNGKALHYLPLRVAANSQDVLVFRLPTATVYRGRAVHGITGKPLARSWAAATVATGRANFAELSDDDWRQLRSMPDVAGPTDAATKIVGRHYGLGALVRTDAQGRFEITEPPGIAFYGIMAFAEGFLPLREVLGVAQRARSDVANLGDLPLFPAAKIQVKIVSAEKSLSVSPEWRLEGGKQPDWIERFRAAADRSRRDFCYVHWMTLNEPRPVLIPSGIRLRVEFSPPYDPRWGSASTEVVQAKQGEVIAAGAFRLPQALPVSARVVDHQGNPIEGLAVRVRHGDQNIWSVAHNTDANGLAHFYIPPNSAGKFRVEFNGPKASRKVETLEAAFHTRASAPDSPIEIRLTADKVRLIPRGQTGKK